MRYEGNGGDAELLYQTALFNGEIPDYWIMHESSVGLYAGRSITRYLPIKIHNTLPRWGIALISISTEEYILKLKNMKT